MIRSVLRLACALVLIGIAAPASAANRPPPRLEEPLNGALIVRSPFGPRHDGFHSGVDLAARRGAPVLAVTAGTVVFAGRRPDYGTMIDLRGPRGMVTRYAHLSAIAPGIRRGSAVAAGRRIGSVGATGNASGPHLHLELRIAGRAVDPMRSLATATARRAPLELAEAPEPGATRHPARRAHRH